LAKFAAAWLPSFRRVYMPSLSRGNATSVARRPAAFQATPTARMLGPSSIRVSLLGSTGECPCSAERITAGLPSSCAWRSAVSTAPACPFA